MSLSTFSIFYFGHSVDNTNNLLNFSEGGPELSATVSIGSFSLSNFAIEVAKAMTTAGGQNYTGTINRAEQTITISAPGVFSLLVATGSQLGNDPFSLMGFTGADLTGAATYTGNLVSGQSYEPQFILQSHIDSNDNQGAVEASVNKSADGTVEVISFGTEKFVEFDIKFITNISQPLGGVIKNNLTGRADAQTFMQNIITKAPFEFMEDISTRTTFETVLLESTPESPVGVAYKLKELFSRSLPGYFETGKLKARVIE